ncbi:MAG TPA: signal recognition particle-docking protein FtsY [Steroidobacteraceae bacterium]|nr:signal recognition particle-docking protein FtsY [Steroidobacteraceae bacterium]
MFDVGSKQAPAAGDAGRDAAEGATPPGGLRGLFSRLRARLNRGEGLLTRDLRELLPGRQIDAQLLDDLETRLLSADVGVDATERVLKDLRTRVARNELADVDALLAALGAAITALLAPVARPLIIDRQRRPFVVLVVGVNGSGKTTSIGKLARRLKDQGLSVMLAAGDTFRAAAVEQLEAWGARNEVPVITQATGADPAAVIFDALSAARARGTDVLLADTAGRLQNKAHLMDELGKVKRVLARLDPSAPHEVLLVLDASQGQNALSQARVFHQALGVTGIVLTKLDGTAKGGIVLAIAAELGIPLRYVGIGESATDFGEFDVADFVSALLAPAGTGGRP